MKEKLLKLWNFLIAPNKTFSLICYGLFAGTSIATIVMLCLLPASPLLLVLYSGMGITFFYCTYLFIRYDYFIIKNAFKSAKLRLSSKNKLLNKYFNDTYFRTMLGTIFSLVLGLGFVAYNAIAGLLYHSVWNGSISIYYGFLVAIRAVFLISEFIFHKKDFEEIKKNEYRNKIFKSEGVLLLLLNVALIAPVTILALSKKQVYLPMWVAIAEASYTFYKVIACIYSFAKSRKSANLSIKGIKNLNLTSATVSMLSLENTMILTFSEEPNTMQLLMIMSAFVVMLINLSIAILTYKSGKKLVNNTNIKEEQL